MCSQSVSILTSVSVLIFVAVLKMCAKEGVLKGFLAWNFGLQVESFAG